MYREPEIPFPNEGLILYHKIENTAANEGSYQDQQVRLTRNSRIILWCLIEGQHLTGLKINHGIINSGMTEIKMIIEYRKRIQEIIKAGIEVTVIEHPDGHKEWYIEENLRNVYAEKYKDVPKQ